MNKIKKIIPIIIAFIIGISTTVGAATVFNSKDITYSSSSTSKTNVKDSLDELYSKLGKCPEGKYCYTEPIGLSDKVELGDYIRMTPTSTSYTISKSLTGYTSDQVINPSELNLWRVIKKNDDGTIDVVSEYASTVRVYVFGKVGYLNLTGTFYTIASQYTNSNYVSKTRFISYSSNQVDWCSSWDQEICPAWVKSDDLDVIKNSLGSIKATTPSKVETSYWVPYRAYNIYEDGRHDLHTFLINEAGTLGGHNLFISNSSLEILSETSVKDGASIRPILTLKENILLVKGNGKSADTAYELE